VINNFFTTWWEGLQMALSQAQLIIHSVVHQLDPTHQSRFTLYNLLVAATVGLAFVALPEVAIGVTGISASLLNAGQYLLIGLQSAPMVGRAMWPTGTVDSRLVQIGNIKSELSQINQEIGGMLNNGLEAVMGDISTFALFASAGHFSGATSFSLPQSTAGLDMALKTFIISNAMTQNGWNAVPQLWMSREEVSSTEYGTRCEFGPDNYDTCTDSTTGTAFWYSNNTGIAYHLRPKGDTPTSNRQLMLDIVENDWSTLPALFDGAFSCIATGYANSSEPFQIRINGTIDLSCVSQLNICLSCGTWCVVPYVNGRCPFANCESKCDSWIERLVE